MNKTDFIDRVVMKGERPKIDKSWPIGFSNLLKSCWHQDPNQRPSFSGIIKELNLLADDNHGIIRSTGGSHGGSRSNSPSITVLHSGGGGSASSSTTTTTTSFLNTASNRLRSLSLYSIVYTWR